MFNVKNAEPEGAEGTICDTCRSIPISYLSLDLDEPMSGWAVFFRVRGVEISRDDIGRLSVERHVLGELVAERELEARLAAERAAQATARKVPVAVGVPAQPDASPYESLVASGEVVTPAQEFGGGRRPAFTEFLDERLDEGRRQTADERAERDAVDRARKLLDGRKDK